MSHTFQFCSGTEDYEEAICDIIEGGSVGMDKIDKIRAKRQAQDQELDELLLKWQAQGDIALVTRLIEVNATEMAAFAQSWLLRHWGPANVEQRECILKQMQPIPS